MAIDLESTGIDELANRFKCIGVSLDHFLGNWFGTSIIAINAHCSQNCNADDLKNKRKVLFMFGRMMVKRLEEPI